MIEFVFVQSVGPVVIWKSVAGVFASERHSPK